MTGAKDRIETLEKTPLTAGREFARRFTNTLCELRLPTGIHQRIERLIEDSADDLGDPGFDEYFGEGRINVKQAVKAVGATSP